MKVDETRRSQSVDTQKAWDFFHTHSDLRDWSETTRHKRTELLSKFLGFPLPRLTKTNLVSEQMEGHIENFIGSVEVPVGLGGPLDFAGDHVQGPIMVPLATSEGALVASTCRGAKLLNECGGVRTTYLTSVMTRAPAFTCRTARDARHLAMLVESHMEDLRQVIQDPHVRLLRVEPLIHGRSMSLNFSFDTGDAAGQNMSTIATWECCQWIVENARKNDVKLLSHYIEGGLNGDKKASHLNFARGRGSRVIAEAWISDEQLQKVMRVKAKDFVQAYLSDIPNYFLNGSIACHTNVTNIVAAVFTATGQDIACVHESSLGQLALEVTEDGFYASLLMPCLVIGTVGGGTNLPAQSEALKIMGCQGPGKKARLAEIIAGYCLALDLSTFSAILEGTFVRAHSELGRRHSH